MDFSTEVGMHQVLFNTPSRLQGIFADEAFLVFCLGGGCVGYYQNILNVNEHIFPIVIPIFLALL
jgi:hypothetical protein